MQLTRVICTSTTFDPTYASDLYFNYLRCNLREWSVLRLPSIQLGEWSVLQLPSIQLTRVICTSYFSTTAFGLGGGRQETVNCELTERINEAANAITSEGMRVARVESPVSWVELIWLYWHDLITRGTAKAGTVTNSKYMQGKRGKYQ